MKITRFPEVIAHRGHGSEPENTLRAFIKGRETGADRVEFDIQKDADGDYVVIHDPTVDRTTDGVGRVDQLTTAQLRRLDAGKGEKLPLFTEVLDWAVRNDVALDIEVKHPHAGDEKQLAGMVRAAGLRDPWVMSFDADFVERFEDCAPEVTTGVLVHERPLFDTSCHAAAIGAAGGAALALATGLSVLPFAGTVAAGLLLGAGVGFGNTLRNLRKQDLDRDVDVHIPGRFIASKKCVAAAHSRGKEVAVYTVDKAKKAEKLIQWGVDAIITNFPERIKQLAD